jgi:hypothetical protein
MKKLFIAVPLIGAMFLTSCKKETETITEIQNNSVAISLEEFNQDYYSSLGYYSSATQNYSVTNIGDKEISSLKVKFEATTSDNSTYTASDYIFDLGVGETVSSQAYISVADKECASVQATEVEITTD